jgi:hypothetical protein
MLLKQFTVITHNAPVIARTVRRLLNKKTAPGTGYRLARGRRSRPGRIEPRNRPERQAKHKQACNAFFCAFLIIPSIISYI